MHYGRNVPVPPCILHIIVDRMIVNRNRLEGGGVRICKCAAWDPEIVTDAWVFKLSWRHNGKTDRIEVARLLRAVGV